MYLAHTFYKNNTYYLMESNPLCSSALGPTNKSPSKAPAITLTCFGRPILEKYQYITVKYRNHTIYIKTII